MASVFYIGSCLDSVASPATSDMQYICTLFSPAANSASGRALESHQRSKHNIRNIIRTYLDASAKCACCGMQFGARVSRLAHLSDKRRPKCRDWILAHCQPLNSVTVAELDLIDNEFRKKSRKAGRTHYIVWAPAINRDGRTVGRASK